MQSNRGVSAGAAASQAAAEAALAELIGRLQHLQLELDRVQPAPAEPGPRGLHAVAAIDEDAPGAEPAGAAPPPGSSPPATTPRAAAGEGEPAAQAALAAIARQTIAQAEQDALEALHTASRQIADIRARTAALLDLSSAAAGDARPIAASPPLARRTSMAAPPALRTPAQPPEERVYLGSVMIEVGPFTNVVQLSEFEEALASVPGVEDVYIRTFERRQAHFELHAREPTPLIAELQARAPDALYVIEAAERHMRLDIFKDEAE